jgi:transmembrane sensor
MSGYRDNGDQEKDRIEQEAADWIANMDRGLSDEEQTAFESWLMRHPENGVMFESMCSIWSNLDELYTDEGEASPDATAPETKQGVQVVGVTRRTPFSRRLVIPAGIAATRLLSLGLLWNQQQLQEPAPAVRYLAEGDFAEHYRNIVLEDGSVVELNQGAQAAVEYTTDQRRIQLLRGKAHFTVVKDATRPFIVNAMGTDVRAVGTAFEVNLKHRVVEVLVTEGTVRIERAVPLDTEDLLADAPIPTHWTAELKTGEKTRIASNGYRSTPMVVGVSEAEIQHQLSWKEQVIDFDSQKLSDVIRVLNRYNSRQLVIFDEELLNMSITVRIKPNNIDSFVRLLALSADVTADESEPGIIFLYRSGKR